QRLTLASELKAEGNSHFQAGHYTDALHAYGQGLACFTYLINRHKEWRKKGIKDEDIQLVRWTGEGDQEHEAVRETNARLLLNIALGKLLHFKLKQYAVCIAACDETLARDGNNSKALYRRAKARTAPPSSGGHELDLAINDLVKACKCDPDDAILQRELAKYKRERKKQKERDQHTFNGFFARGSIMESAAAPASEPHADHTSSDRAQVSTQVRGRSGDQIDHINRVSGSKGVEGDTQQRGETIKDMECYLKQLQERHEECMREDDAEGAAAIELRMSTVEGTIAALTEAQRKLRQKQPADWMHPSEEMIAEAAKDGIDLRNMATREFLQKLQDEHDGSRNEEGFDEGQPKCSRDVVIGAIQAMTLEELKDMLRDMGHDLEGWGQYSREELNQIALKAIEDQGGCSSQNGRGNARGKRKGRDEKARRLPTWALSLCFMVFTTLLRLAGAAGLFAWAKEALVGYVIHPLQQ
ncbi:unnamed protein product, partial [Chrysoparadoxa australica]